MSSSILARTGRHRQRYVDQLRLVAGCIPYKFAEEAIDDQNRILVLMISTPNRNDLVFPKGGWEDDETLDQAARREALEEAGVIGILNESCLGEWEFRSKSSQSSCSSGGGCRGYMFALEVTEEFEHWPGQASYSRKWLTIDEAYKLCRYDWMREALQKFVETMHIQTELRLTRATESACEVALQTTDQIPDVVGVENQILSSTWFASKSGVHVLEESSVKCIVQG